MPFSMCIPLFPGLPRCLHRQSTRGCAPSGERARERRRCRRLAPTSVGALAAARELLLLLVAFSRCLALQDPLKASPKQDEGGKNRCRNGGKSGLMGKRAHAAPATAPAAALMCGAGKASFQALPPSPHLLVAPDALQALQLVSSQAAAAAAAAGVGAAAA